MTEPIIAASTELPEGWARPAWLAAPKKTSRLAPIEVLEVRVPFEMEPALRARSLDVRAYPVPNLVYDVVPSVLVGAVSLLPLPDDVKARWGERPFWVLAEGHRWTVYEKHPESRESELASAEILAGLDAQPHFAAIESHVGTTDNLDVAFHGDIDVATAVAAFQADGFRVIRLLRWPPRAVPSPEVTARLAVALTSPSTRFGKSTYGVYVTEVTHPADGSERHEGLGPLISAFDAMADEGLMRILPSLPKRSIDGACALYLAARFGGTEHEATALSVAARAGGAEALAEHGVASTSLALPFAELLENKRVPSFAPRWLRTHVPHAVAGLLPLTLSGDATARSALRALWETHPREVLACSELHGAPARERLQAMLEGSAATPLRGKLPEVPAFASPSLHPPLLLTNGHQVSEPSVQSLLTMFLLSRPGAPYPALSEARAALEARSADAFACSLLAAWEASAHRGGEWVFVLLAHLGGDACARRLAARIAVWPGEKMHAWALTGIDALAQMHDDGGLSQLIAIAQTVRFPALRVAAAERVQELAELRGLSPDELADRSVPDLGLDEDGTRVLSFGARSFRVVFDEGLTPRLKSEAGALLATLPKPNGSDDAVQAKQAAAQWKVLKADSKAIARREVMRLETMMCSTRTVSSEVFRTCFVEHPLVRHLAARLVWQANRRARFRVAEDGTLAGLDDTRFTLDDDAEVGLVHRLDLTSDEAQAWGQRLADYQILPPFEQLARSTFELTAAEQQDGQITRAPFTAKLGSVTRLEQRGWRKGPTEDGGAVHRLEKALPHGVAELPLKEGIWVGDMAQTPKELTITGITFRGQWEHEHTRRIALSELVRDLESLR
jgi:hypothetical protein